VRRSLISLLAADEGCLAFGHDVYEGWGGGIDGDILGRSLPLWPITKIQRRAVPDVAGGFLRMVFAVR